MNKSYLLIVGLILLIAARPILAQHQHGGGMPSGGMPSAGMPSGGGAVPGYGGGMGDFEKAIAIQATERQAIQLRSWAERTAALDRQIENIRRISESQSLSGLSNEIEQLEAVLAADNMDRQDFLVSLSKAQHSGLQKPVRELTKTDRAMAKAFSEIKQGSGQTQDTKLLTKGLQRPKKTIAIERDQQERIAHEMGASV